MSARAFLSTAAALACASCSSLERVERFVPERVEQGAADVAAPTTWTVSFRDPPTPESGVVDCWSGGPGVLRLRGDESELELSVYQHRWRVLAFGLVLPVFPWVSGEQVFPNLALRVCATRAPEPVRFHMADVVVFVPGRGELRPYRVTRGQRYPIGADANLELPGVVTLAEGEGAFLHFHVTPTQVETFELGFASLAPDARAGRYRFRAERSFVLRFLFGPLDP